MMGIIDAGLKFILVADAHAEDSDKAEIAEHPEAVFVDAFLYPPDEADHPVRQILDAVVIVIDQAVGGGAHGVEGEIPAPRIGAPIFGEFHHRVAAVEAEHAGVVQRRHTPILAAPGPGRPGEVS